MTKTIYAFILLLGCAAATAQLSDFRVYKPQPQGAHTLQNMLQGLVGDGIVLKNYSVSKTWSEEAFGSFEDGRSRLGMKKGLIMTTGGITSLCGKNTRGDMSNYTHETAARKGRPPRSNGYSCADLEKFLGGNTKTYDAVVIEMDIVPTSDSLSFNYVFGSEEYDEFVGSTYNDVFAFFISGKGLEGQVNLAVVPGTKDPVSVNSINNGSPTYRSRASHPTFFVSNADGALGIEYDGLTRLMQIRQAVTPHETYHLRLAIADVSDNAYDSGVLIEGHSIVSYEKSYNVLYDKNASDISEPYKNLLNALAKEYKTKTESRISITGHTDSEGDMDYNRSLSCKRAELVKEYLMGKGVPESRLIVNCKGESMPAYENTSEAGRHMNRRVELMLLGNHADYLSARQLQPVNENASRLINNVPNPFSGSTSIQAFIKEDVKEAVVAVHDIAGKLIKTVYLLERGNTSLTFDGYSLSPGVYIATLMSDGSSAGSVKMILQQ